MSYGFESRFRYQMKTCTKCKTEQGLTEFRKDRTKTDGYSPHCKTCRKAQDQINHKERYGVASRSRTATKRAENLKLVVLYKLQNPCILCGEDEPSCLDFHHPDPSDKEFNVAEYYACSWAKIHKEMLKCVVVCRNCHAKIHAGLITLL